MTSEQTDAAQMDPGAAVPQPVLAGWDERAADALDDAARYILQLESRLQLLQMKCDTVDQLCSMGKTPLHHGNSVSTTVGRGIHDSYMLRRMRLLVDERIENVRQQRMAAADSITLGL